MTRKNPGSRERRGRLVTNIVASCNWRKERMKTGKEEKRKSWGSCSWGTRGSAESVHEHAPICSHCTVVSPEAPSRLLDVFVPYFFRFGTAVNGEQVDNEARDGVASARSGRTELTVGAVPTLCQVERTML